MYLSVVQKHADAALSTVPKKGLWFKYRKGHFSHGGSVVISSRLTCFLHPYTMRKLHDEKLFGVKCANTTKSSMLFGPPVSDAS